MGLTIWYMDETSTNLWERLRRIWQPQGGIRIKKSKQHKHNITIMGALCHGKLFTRLAPTTNTLTVENFFLEMAKEHDLSANVMVLDNHAAHGSRKVRELFEDMGCELLFLPPATSILNPIEVVWAHVKRQWRQSLLSTDQSNVGESWMVGELGRICAGFSRETLENLATAHFKDAIEVLREASQHCEQHEPQR